MSRDNKAHPFKGNRIQIEFGLAGNSNVSNYDTWSEQAYPILIPDYLKGMKG